VDEHDGGGSGMHAVTRGSGTPLVIIPGIQGRWEYLAPAIGELSKSFRVLTFWLFGERARGDRRLRSAASLDTYAEQVDRVLDEHGIEQAVICGISFGGLAALRFAASRPHRTRALVLVSTPSPRWRPQRRHLLYSRIPWLFGFLFVLETPARLRPELMTAFPDWRARYRFVVGQLLTLARVGLSLRSMASRASLFAAPLLEADCSAISAPALIVTGERSLDRVVPVGATLEYLNFLPGAQAVLLERTGHLGSITRPRTFAAALRDFIEGPTHGIPAQPHGSGIEAPVQDSDAPERGGSTTSSPRPGTNEQRTH
jgi:pimeloyl-ACP methyl ester carboxylesterase